LMNTTLSIALVGGDRRQLYLCDMLRQEGHSLSVYCMEIEELPKDVKAMHSLTDGFCKCDVVVLPMPLSRDGERLNTPMSNTNVKLVDLAANLPKNIPVLGGSISEKTAELFDKYNIQWTDYLLREELAILNAIPVALGIWQ